MPADLAAQIEAVARRLLGEPNRTLSSRTQWRYGTHGSLCVEVAGDRAGTRFDFEANDGGGVLDLVTRQTGLAKGEAAEWLGSELGVHIDGKPQAKPKRRMVATYDYRNEAGELLFQVVRNAPKDFRQRRPDGDGGWTWRVKGVRPLPYRLFELRTAAPEGPVLIVEGEKDVDRLDSLGFVATCNAGGANKWPAGLNPHFQDLTVCILPDGDEAGRSHAEKVAASLHGTAASVRIVTLPGLVEGGDVSDWLDGGGDADQLVALCQAAPLWAPVAANGGPSLPPESAFLIPYCDESLTLAFSARHADDVVLRPDDISDEWTRGKPMVQLSKQTTALQARRAKHSAKPDAFYDLVESLCPAPRYCELFQRRLRPNWDGHGDERRLRKSSSPQPHLQTQTMTTFRTFPTSSTGAAPPERQIVKERRQCQRI
jgi:hypothetical protein